MLNTNVVEHDLHPHEERTSFFAGLSLTELAYLFVMFYAVLGAPLGLTIGNVGVGILMVLVLGVCLVEGGSDHALVLKQISWALASGVSYLLIQFLVHDESSSQLYVRNVGIWIPSLIVVQWLVGREQFLPRFAFVTIALGFAMLPYMNTYGGGGYQRFGLDNSVGFANPNDLGCWYGFCALYLTVAGFSARTTASRIVFWVLGLLCLFLVTLTLSRSPLIAMAGALLVASRRIFKESFPLLLLLAGLAYGAMLSGVFDTALKSYGLRATEETGRLRIWPMLIEKFLNAPFVGIGASHAGAVDAGGKFITPHNGFMLIGVSSGIVPLTFFVAHWIKAGVLALRATVGNWPLSEYQLPLLVYALLVTNTGNQSFMAPWAIVCLALPFCSPSSGRPEWPYGPHPIASQRF
ncbi:MAG: O-antigen ligase domain-containing protein [Thermomicrobiales bacterium]|nr:MAG: O-antigen ligase domain-containing protein [Thermomicrobiales bacterium]